MDYLALSEVSDGDPFITDLIMLGALSLSQRNIPIQPNIPGYCLDSKSIEQSNISIGTFRYSLEQSKYCHF